MKTISLLSFLFLSSFVFSQDVLLNKYDQFISEKDKAETLYLNNQFKEAIIAFDKVLGKHEKSKFHVDIYFEQAECYFKLKKPVKAIDVLKESIKYGATKGYFDNGYIIGDSLCQFAWKSIQPEYISLRRKYYSNLENPDVFLEVENLMAIDQFGRRFSSFEEIVDQENIEKFIEIVKEHGWQQNGWILLWHHRDTYKQDNEVWNFFIPFFEKEIQKGNLPKSYLAMFEDNSSLEKTGFSVYGTNNFGPVNKDTVNIKRKEINLKPFTDEQIEKMNN